MQKKKSEKKRITHRSIWFILEYYEKYVWIIVIYVNFIIEYRVDGPVPYIHTSRQ